MSEKRRRGKWDELLEWAGAFPGFECHATWSRVAGAGAGLVASSSKRAEEPLLVVPASALLNPLTLLSSPGNTIPPHLFPRSLGPATKKRRLSKSAVSASVSGGNVLNTTQLLTLHLALTRDPQRRHPSDWAVYLSTIPRTFRPWHPLTWTVSPRSGIDTDDDGTDCSLTEWARWTRLLEIVPLAAKANVLRVKERFDVDLFVLQRVLREEEPFKSQKLAKLISINDILWAWLNVNTRSVSLDLGIPGPTDLYNHTLVPLLDLVNHSSEPTQCIPKPRQIPTPTSSSSSSTPAASAKTAPRSRVQPHLVPGKIAFALLAPERGMRQGEELRFEYHGHCNSELWAEYGFAERPRAILPTPPNSNGQRNGDSDGGGDGDNGEPTANWTGMRHAMVDVGNLIDLLCAADGTAEKEAVLRKIGCWGQNTLHAFPAYEPSHALLMTLRVLHLPARSASKLEGIGQGTITFISPDNERKVKASLRHIYDHVLGEARRAQVVLDEIEVKSGDLDESGGELREAMSTIRVLWDEQRDIAEGCLRAHVS